MLAAARSALLLSVAGAFGCHSKEVPTCESLGGFCNSYPDPVTYCRPGQLTVDASVCEPDPSVDGITGPVEVCCLIDTRASCGTVPCSPGLSCDVYQGTTICGGAPDAASNCGAIYCYGGCACGDSAANHCDCSD
jgi:hypothetical protein